VRRALARRVPTAVVLAYHRVASPALDPQLMCVSAERFAGHLQVMARLGQCTALRDLVRWSAVGRVPRRAIVVTFDDGYADNLAVAEPLLRAAGVSATVFVSSGDLETGRRFWWDELEALLLHAEHLPPTVAVTAQGRSWEWPLEPAHGAGSSAGAEAADWDVTRPETPSPRHAAYRDIAALCRGLAPDERDAVLGSLIAQLGEPPDAGEHCRLSPAQVAELSASPVVEVGAHGVSHSALSVLAPGQRREELWLGKRTLEEVTGRQVDLLSYPFGAPGDLTEDCARLAGDCGYIAACANRAALVWRFSDPYRLPRFLVRDWEADEFASRLEAWFAGRV
jgi:peptidoglycan/xylan/chitin deacetylase (PgdA/CDA1 family)